MGGGGELVTSKATLEKDHGCFSCGKLDHWIQNCPWNGSPCKRCDVGRVVRTSQQPHSFGQKFLSCPNPKCRGFQWMKDALKESIEQQTQQQPTAGLGDKDMVKLLLRKVVNKEICNHLGKAAYDVAAESGHTILFDVLRLGDKLSKAARKGEERAINWLLDNGASINGAHFLDLSHPTPYN
ncbi:hypothetical protein IFM89_011196 [Coptis chinensis]|uniref:CCHC-type domain-containing protein n=1 Tax=Coptis chinensis TaxID=261450 RepID=A0A835LVL5_9MAGN|nr:hypothetical protein IFM89_011196 [Coptis chinensis]